MRKRKMPKALLEYWKNKRGKKSKRRVSSVAKRKGRKRSAGFGGFGLGKLLTIKNIMLTGAGAILLPKVAPQVSANIGGAIGGYMGSKSIVGAVVGYLLGPTLNGVGSGLLGGITNGSSINGVSGYGT
jgi:hypothetical protein